MSQSLRVACVMMQRDEDLLLEAWIYYHAWLFGIENLSIYDNGSDNPRVHQILDHYERFGMFVDRSATGLPAFAAKGEIITARMRDLRDRGQYDFLFPMDCDEFIGVRTYRGFACDRETILRTLAELRHRPETLKIQHEFLNHPDCPGYYELIYCNKTFYAAEHFSYTDHGFHCAGASSTTSFHQTALAHIHYHRKPFGRLLSDTRRKLKALGVDLDNAREIEEMAHSLHLKPYLAMTPDQYLEWLDDRMYLYQPEFIRRLSLSGLTAEGVLQCCSDLQKTPRNVLPATFDPNAYLSANNDLFLLGEDSLLHYMFAGWREGRPIRS